MVEAGRGVQVDDLVVLGRHVAALALEVRDLHKVPRRERLADVDVVGTVVKGRRHELHAEAAGDARELRAHAVGALERALVEEVVVRPAAVLAVGLPRVVRVEQRQVVAFFWWFCVFFCDDDDDLMI